MRRRRRPRVRAVTVNAVPDVYFAGFFVPIFADRWELEVADGTDVAFVDAGAVLAGSGGVGRVGVSASGGLEAGGRPEPGVWG